MRYFLSQDQSAHWYIIPAERRAEWEQWCSLPEDDEASWEVPWFAQRIGGSPSLVTFEEPIEIW